jgi:23S rRNA (guanosine2251-2'-O)-methyltransferase
MNERRFPAPAPARTPSGRPEPEAGNSGKNQKKRAAEAGREAEEEQRTLQPGLKPVLELLETDPSRLDAVFLRKGRKGAATDRILDLCRSAGVRFSLVDDAFLARLWPGNHQGVIARLYAAGFTDLETALEAAAASPLPLLLAFDQVQDPGNAGAMARTLYALGGAGLIVPRHNGVYLGAAAAKAGAGALEHLAVVKAANLGQALDAAAKAGFAVYGASSSPVDGVGMLDAFAFRPDFPAVLALGGEESGLRPTIARRCRALLRIPLARAFDSLNVAQAGAILMAGFAAARGK